MATLSPASSSSAVSGAPPGGHVRAVIVTPHRAHRRITGQLVQGGRGAHVAGVQDQIRPAQLPGHRGRAARPAPRRVRVGQHDHPHRFIVPYPAGQGILNVFKITLDIGRPASKT